MPKSHAICFAALIVILSLAGCRQGMDQTDSTISPDDALPRHSGPEQTGVDSMDLSPDMQIQVDAAVTDLAQRLAIAADEINLVRAEAVVWRDGSLGCPREDMMYTQVLVPGTLIVLGFEGKHYHYHAGRGGPPAYCEKPQPPATAVSPD